MISKDLKTKLQNIKEIRRYVEENVMKHNKTRKLLQFFIDKDEQLQLGTPVTDTTKRLVKMELNRSENAHFYKNMIIFVLSLTLIALWISH